MVRRCYPPIKVHFGPFANLDYHITGIPAPGEDATQIQTIITVDETKPVVQFSTAPLSLDDEDLDMLQFSVLIIEDGGMPCWRSASQLGIHAEWFDYARWSIKCHDSICCR